MKNHFSTIVLAAVMLCFAGTLVASAQNSLPDSLTHNRQRPKIGITFAGGGAKGAAHIGVLKVLEEVGIPIDYITGTSMGSIIGALYSLGYSANQMDTIISGMDWSLYMSDRMDRSGVNSVEKENQGKYLLSIPFNTGGLHGELDNQNQREKKRSFKSSLPGGFISGSNILNLFNCLSVGYQDSMDFNDLPIPYACVASDMTSGRPVVLRSGRLPEAIRSSMAIPGVFAPVKYNDMVLVDGGMFNNFPVDVCAEMGADIIIGVEVTKDPVNEAQYINSLPELLGRLFAIITQQGTAQNRERCTIYLRPDISGFGTLSFDSESVKTIIQRGYEAADKDRELFVALRRELDKLDAPARTEYKHIPAKNISPFSSQVIELSSVAFEGADPRDARWLMRKSGLENARFVNGKDLERAMSICYGTNAFKTINYYLTEGETVDGRYDLVIKTTPSEPHVFGLGFRVDSQEAAAILLRFGLNQYKLSGFKQDYTARLSYNPWVNATLSYVPRVFPSINLALNFRRSESIITLLGDKSMSAAFNKYNAELYLSQYHFRNVTIASGVKLDAFRYSSFMTKMEESIPAGSNNLLETAMYAGGNYRLTKSDASGYDDTIDDTPDMGEQYNTSALGLFARFKYDNLDRNYFATRGVRFSTNLDWRFKALGLTSHSGSAQLGFESYIPIGGRFVIVPQFYGRTLFGTYKYAYCNFMGGAFAGRYYEQQLPFIGINKPELMQQTVAIARADFRLNIIGKHYLSGIFNYCRETPGFEDYFITEAAADWYGAGLEYSYNSMFGPLSLDIHWSNIGRDIVEKPFLNRLGIYINLGYNF
ncbi:MAG: patatin-like phospholipase family protein [Bacteroidales bacterium]|nr:patatin-like phospholipase family protein [Bacteroidales bacterium]MDD4670455.1 patatin-like phospholipase family protein [Bacteroidales bacterium]